MRVAVLGMGSAGRRHSAGLAERGHEVVGFDPAGAPEGIEAAASVADALDGSDAAVVATPSSMHAEHALEALRRHLPVLVEKPLATDPADARRVAEAARDAGMACGVAMNMRFVPAIVALRRLVAGGDLGAPLLARASFGQDLRQWRPGTDYRAAYSARADLGGGIVLDAIHELDYLLWLLGPASSVAAQVGHLSDLEIDVEDAATAAIRFESGALAAVDLNFFEHGYRRDVVLAGSRATASWSWDQPAIAVREEDGGEREVPIAGDPAGAYGELLDDFLAAVGEGRDPLTSAEEGLRAVQLAAAVKVSSREGRGVDPRTL